MSTAIRKNLEAAQRASAKRTKAAEDFAAYVDDPVGLVRRVLRLEPWSKQADVLCAVAEQERVAVRAGHKVGKTDLDDYAAIWFALTRPGSRVIMTAPTYRQVRHVLWKRLKQLVARMPKGLIVDAHDSPEHGVIFTNGSEILGFTADNAEKFAGLSGADMLFILDEASGIEPEIFEAVEGSAAGGARILLTGNPTRSAGHMHAAFHDKAEFWTQLHISSEETPNVIAGKVVIPGLATKQWVAQRAADWGVSSALYSVRVLGDWPRQGSNTICTIEAVEAAHRRWSADLFEQEKAPTTIGLDPARFGSDESCAFVVRGMAALPPYLWRGLDGIQLAARVFDLAREKRRPGETVRVLVDTIGIGASVYDQLRLFDELTVVDVNAGEASTKQTYSRKRDELWFGIAEWMKRGGALPTDAKLTGELIAVEYTFLPNGKIKVQGKDELRAVLGRSPDRADALALAVFSSQAKLASFNALPFKSPGTDWGGSMFEHSDGDDDWGSLSGMQVMWTAPGIKTF